MKRFVTYALLFFVLSSFVFVQMQPSDDDVLKGVEVFFTDQKLLPVDPASAFNKREGANKLQQFIDAKDIQSLRIIADAYKALMAKMLVFMVSDRELGFVMSQDSQLTENQAQSVRTFFLDDAVDNVSGISNEMITQKSLTRIDALMKPGAEDKTYELKKELFKQDLLGFDYIYPGQKDDDQKEFRTKFREVFNNYLVFKKKYLAYQENKQEEQRLGLVSDLDREFQNIKQELLSALGMNVDLEFSGLLEKEGKREKDFLALTTLALQASLDQARKMLEQVKIEEKTKQVTQKVVQTLKPRKETVGVELQELGKGEKPTVEPKVPAGKKTTSFFKSMKARAASAASMVRGKKPEVVAEQEQEKSEPKESTAQELGRRFGSDEARIDVHLKLKDVTQSSAYKILVIYAKDKGFWLSLDGFVSTINKYLEAGILSEEKLGELKVFDFELNKAKEEINQGIWSKRIPGEKMKHVEVLEKLHGFYVRVYTRLTGGRQLVLPEAEAEHVDSIVENAVSLTENILREDPLLLYRLKELVLEFNKGGVDAIKNIGSRFPDLRPNALKSAWHLFDLKNEFNKNKTLSSVISMLFPALWNRTERIKSIYEKMIQEKGVEAAPEEVERWKTATQSKLNQYSKQDFKQDLPFIDQRKRSMVFDQIGGVSNFGNVGINYKGALEGLHTFYDDSLMSAWLYIFSNQAELKEVHEREVRELKKENQRLKDELLQSRGGAGEGRVSTRRPVRRSSFDEWLAAQ